MKNQILQVVVGHFNQGDIVTQIAPKFKPAQIVVTLENGDEVRHDFEDLDEEECKRQWNQALAYWRQVHWGPQFGPTP